jgi:opacity protein-like surface antigen
MKKLLRLSLLTLALATGAAANAATSESFSAGADESFTKNFTVTPTASNSVILTVGGLGIQLTGLTFTIAGGPTVTATLLNGNWVATFNDVRNSGYNFGALNPLTVTVTGHTSASLPGGNAVVSLSTRNGTIVSSVPEPETFALLLAGLGVVGAMAARRKKPAG